MRKQIYSAKYSESTGYNIHFAFLPTIVFQAHPTHRTAHLIWLEGYEIYNGVKFLVDK